MSNPQHLEKIMQGAEAWNHWRADVAKTARVADRSMADLSGADLAKANLTGADLNWANLGHANLGDADLRNANLRNAELSGANLIGANLTGADLSWAYLIGANTNLTRANLYRANLMWARLAVANLSEANLTAANLTGADLSWAYLRGAGLEFATLAQTHLERADLTGCYVYGISVWNVNLKGAVQSNLVITPRHSIPGPTGFVQAEPVIQVDNLEVAQFIYLLLNNESIRRVIDAMTSKVVLILGRFTPERIAVLEAIRGQLREKGYLPVLFDFDKPETKDLTGTVSTLANMARFIIADLTDASSVPHELAMVVPGTIVPVQAILLEGQREYAMFPDLMSRHHWVLKPYTYESKELLMAHLSEHVIAPAEAKAEQLRRK